MNLTPQQILDAIATYGAPEIQALLDGLCPCLSILPVAALLRLADEAAKALAAKNELAAMQAGVGAADAAADAAEEAALKS